MNAIDAAKYRTLHNIHVEGVEGINPVKGFGDCGFPQKLVDKCR